MHDGATGYDDRRTQMSLETGNPMMYSAEDDAELAYGGGDLYPPGPTLGGDDDDADA
jgi:hypothetical protein